MSLLALVGCATAAPASPATPRTSLATSEDASHIDPPVAAAPLRERGTLADYQAYAARHNPEVAAAYDRWRAAEEAIVQAGTLPNPQLTYARYLEEIETRVGPQENRVGVSQMFPWIGTLGARADQARAMATAAKRRYEQHKLSVDSQVAEAYAEYYYLGRSLLITEENLALLRHFEEVARRRYEVGEADYSDVIRAQVELGKLADRVRTLEATRPALAARLNATLNRPADAPLPWAERLPEPDAAYPAEGVVRRVARQNYELQALDSEITAANEAVELARLRSFPNVTLGLDWIDTDRAIMRTPESGKDAVVAMVSFSVPIWVESNRAARREAQARLDAATRARQARENTLVSTVELARFRYDDARRKLHLFRDTLIPKAQQALQATETAFTTGAGDFLALLDAQRTLLEFQLSAERALADATQRSAEIAMLLGAPEPAPAAAPPDPAQGVIEE